MKRSFYIGIFICFLFDFFLKRLVLSLDKVITVIPNFFSITLVKNTGAAFSIGKGYSIVFVFIAILVLFYIFRFLLKEKQSKFQTFFYMILIGGIIGNLFDRIVYGEVIDFLSFSFFGYNFPVFNLADVFICVGAILLVFDIVRGEISENRSKCK